MKYHGDSDMWVTDFIDFEGGKWKEVEVQNTFIEDDSSSILDIPLFHWPCDRLFGGHPMMGV